MPAVSTRIARILATGAVLGLLAVACSNSGSAKPTAVTTRPGASGASGVTEFTGADLQKQVPLTGVQGVTDSEIRVAVITAGTNPLAGDFRTYANGIQAYFDMVNSQGGLYGRQLKIAAKHDDQFINNQQVVKASLAQDNAFATFIATALFTGAPEIAAASSMPTFIWNINKEFAGKPNLFGHSGAICFDCAAQILPYVAQEMKFENVAVLAYGSPAASKECAGGIKASFEKYPSAKVAYFDDNLQLAQPDLSAQVSQMKKKGVEIVFTCIDQRESLILAKEMAKQHLDAVQTIRNSYDTEFIADNAQYLEGSFVSPQFAALENEPQLPVQQQFAEWMGKSGKRVSEYPAYGWINALQFVHGLKLAGPNFSQQKVIDSLNQDTHFDADGMIVPIDWTKQHNNPSGGNGIANQYAADYQCVSLTRVHDGKFVPVLTKPGKQFTCMVGAWHAPTLTKNATHENFAD